MQGFTVEPLRLAIDGGDLATVRALVSEEPALLNAIVRPGPNRDYRPLTEAAVECQLEILRFLIDAGCDVREDHNYPMFRTALYERCIPAMEMLVRHGAGVDAVWDDYGPPIIASCEGMAPGCMRWLLDNGARIDGAGPGKTREVPWSAVEHAGAFYKWRPELLELVLERGGDVNSRGWRGQTALHAAARRGDVAGVKRLLQAGAELSLTDAAGRRPIEVTRNKKIRLLLEEAATECLRQRS
jgi:ankyrin repeat protein